MRWYEYKMEADDLRAPDDLKAKLMAMTDQLTEEEKNQPMLSVPESAAPVQEAADTTKKKKLIHFPLKQVGALAACLAVCVAGYGALSTGMLDLGAKSSGAVNYSAASTAPMMASGRAAVNTEGAAAPQVASYDTYDLGSSVESGTATLSADDAAAVEGTSSTQSAKIIYTANLTLESKDYDTARQALDDALSAADGWLESSSEYTSGDSTRSVSLTYRVPQDNYESFLAAAAAAGKVTYKSQDADDVTTQYMDVETRLTNLEAQRTRLQQLQQQAESLADLLEIESSLTDVQSQIESWQSQLDWYSNQVQQCTVYVTLNEVDTYSPETESFGARLAAALGNGWTAFVNGLQEFAVAVIYLLPVIVLVGAAVVIVRKWRKAKKHPKK